MSLSGPRAGWTVLVTGASSGLGRSLALELAREGCSLVLTGRDPGRLGAVANEATVQGAPRVVVVVSDLSAEGGVPNLLHSLEDSKITVDALVNNAGAGRAGTWASGTADSDRAILRLLIDAPMALTRGLSVGWRSRGKGAILNVASTGAFQPGPQTAVYYAAKAFLASWSLALAREERSWLVVTTLCPGALKTGFSETAGKTDVPGAPGPGKTARTAIKAWKKNRGLVVPGFFNKVAVFVSRLIPLAWSAAGVEAVQLAVKKR